MLHYLERAREELTPGSSRMAEQRAAMEWREDVRSEKRKREEVEREEVSGRGRGERKKRGRGWLGQRRWMMRKRRGRSLASCAC
jgi:hypothetical protein